MAFPTLKPPGGGKVPAQAGQQNHGHAMQMAHSAASKVRLAKALGGGGGLSATPPMAKAAAPAGGGLPPAGGISQHAGSASLAVNGNYRQHIAGAIPNLAPGEVHQAIGTLVQQGKLTGFQGSALMQHQGPLLGAKGASTAHMIAGEVLNNRARRPAPPQPVGPPRQPGPPQVPGGQPMVRGGMGAPMPQRPMGGPPAQPGMGMPQRPQGVPGGLPMGAGMPPQ